MELPMVLLGNGTSTPAAPLLKRQRGKCPRQVPALRRPCGPMLLLVGPFQEGGADVGDESMEYRSVLQQLRIPSVIRPERHTSVVLR